MKDRNRIAEMRAEPLGEHRCERYLGNKHERCLATIDSLTHCAHVNFGLSTARHSVEQKCRILVLFELVDDLIQSFLLFRGQGHACGWIGGVGCAKMSQRVAADFACEDLDVSAFLESLDDRGADPRHLGKPREGDWFSRFKEQIGNPFLRLAEGLAPLGRCTVDQANGLLLFRFGYRRLQLSRDRDMTRPFEVPDHRRGAGFGEMFCQIAGPDHPVFGDQRQRFKSGRGFASF